MCKLPVVFTLGIALIAVGCSPKEKEPVAVDKPVVVPGIKDLVKEDLVKGKPSEFWPNRKPVELGDKVFVRYKGYFKDGVEFDGNLGPDGQPYSFIVGHREVIQGWEQGIIGMLPGGKRKLHVPAKLAYGDRGSPPKIAANTDLYFDLELVDYVKDGSPNEYGIKDRKIGTGATAKSGSSVTIEYEVRAAGDPTIFDSSKMQNLKPTFVIGSEKAMIGVEDGIIGMKVGGEREIWLPPVLSPVMPDLEGWPREGISIFKVKLLAVK